MLPQHSRAVASLFLVLAAACSPASEPIASGPDIVLVTLDTVRADALSAYRPGARTPALDALASEGVRFERALSASAVTPVSHASILTGLYPYHHGLRVLSAGSGYRLAARQPTLATHLRDAGYFTAAVHSAFPVSEHFGLERGYEVFDSLHGDLERDVDQTRWDVASLQRRSDATTDAALRIARESGRPLFLWVHYWDPHDALVLPPESWIEGVPRAPDGALVDGDARYAAEISYLDAQIGRLLEGLAAAGVGPGALIAVVSDHGEGLSDGERRHGWRFHRMLYQEQLHVPLLLRLPGVKPGLVVPAQVRSIDVAPTLLDYAGLPVPGDLDGASLRPLIEGAEQGPRTAYADQINGYDWNAGMIRQRPDAAFLYALSDGRWKLVYRAHEPSRSELFDLRADPQERRNLLARHPAEAKRLLAELAGRRPWVTEPFAEDETSGEWVQTLLGALGYAADTARSEWTWEWKCPAEALGLDSDGDCGEGQVPVGRLVPAE